MRRLDLDLPILYSAQFSQADVLAVADITAGQLKGILDRKQVRLMTEHNPGTGRRRMFTGSDILKITTANLASRIGFPLRWVYLLADRVERRASGLLSGTALELCKEFGLAFYPNKAGDDWAFVPILDGNPVSPLPVAVQALDVDRLINETVAKLNALVADEPLPDFSIPEPKPEPSPYSPENDFFRKWMKDEEGRNLLVGLDAEETAFYLEYTEKRGPQDFPTIEEFDDARDRYLDLHNKHEIARFKRLNDEAPQRSREFWEKNFPGTPLPDFLREKDGDE